MGTFRSVVPSLQLCSCYKYSTAKGLERTSLIFLLWCPLKMGTLRSVVPSLQLCSCYKYSTAKGLERTSLIFLLWCPVKMGTFRSVVPSLQLCSCYKHSTTKVWKEHPLYSSFDVHWKWAHSEVLSRRYSFALVTNIAPQRFGKNIPYIPPLMSTENGHVEKCCPVATALLLLQT